MSEMSKREEIESCVMSHLPKDCYYKINYTVIPYEDSLIASDMDSVVKNYMAREIVNTIVDKVEICKLEYPTEVIYRGRIICMSIEDFTKYEQTLIDAITKKVKDLCR